MKAIILIFIIALSFVSASAQTGIIKLNITGINPKKGKDIKIALYKEDGFLKEILIHKTIQSKGKAAYVEFTIEMGKYAISLFQDENSDGKLNTNFIGKPKELSGFSNNAKGSYGHPEFGDAAFNVTNGKTVSLKIKLE